MKATTRLAARLVEYEPGQFAALPPHTTLELVEHPRPVPLPGGAWYGCGLLVWQDERIPLIELDTLLQPLSRNRSRRAAPRYALVLAWQSEPGAPIAHGAVALDRLPQLVMLDDPRPCDFPDGMPAWPGIALACFEHEGRPVPVLDTAALFGRFHG